MSTTLPKSVQAALGGAQSLREAELAIRMEMAKFPAFDTQLKLIPGRRFRFDVVFPWPWKVAVELQGGQHVRGRHNRSQGYEADSVKSALAQSLGWLVIAVTPAQVKDGTAVALISGALRSRGWEPLP